MQYSHVLHTDKGFAKIKLSPVALSIRSGHR